MSDTTTETVEPATETVVEPTESATPDLAAEAAKWKALSRKNEERAKENEAAAKRLAEIEEANKSEAEKLLARAEAAEKVIAERDAKEAAEKLIAEVAKEKGVPANALRGATREDLEAHADELLALIPVTPVAPSADGQGNVGEPIGGGTDQIKSREELQKMTPQEIESARVAGRLKDLGY